ncbi:MAG TPA: hypothetical protein VGS80_25170, partial [Ktedonobacterales bacterium]|nr:hypothetical protein [Ktedonobacterales bacterium]
GRRSSSRQRLAVSGMLLSALVVVCFCLTVVVLYIGWSQAFRYGALPGDDRWRYWATLLIEITFIATFTQRFFAR